MNSIHLLRQRSLTEYVSDSFQDFLKEVVKEPEPSSVDLAVQELGLASRHDPLPGMNIILKPFQLLGVSW